ncbi:putative aminotransferase [Lachnellula suecica]|uniref:Putative aminotransferase n=1 Tax=Lachnellula suecica TaxID=602035 RepID=A0A8T9BU22_9HELO|nr:putative aminotransferase [Lachnellula suecica]
MFILALIYCFILFIILGERDNDYITRLANELEDEFQRIGPHRVCAFVAETVGGSSTGCATAIPGYFKAMQAVCQRHGALLILDEVMCGMGRTGTMHAWEQEGVVPDIQTVGKGLGGGYAPISAVLINKWMVTALQEGGKDFAHGQTYMAHPLSAAAALKVQRIIQTEDLLGNVRCMGQYLEAQLKQKLSGHRYVGDIRGRGLFWAVEFVADKGTKTPFPAALNLHSRLHSKGLSKGYELALFNAPGAADGYSGDHIVLAPPYIVNEADIDDIVERLVRVIDDTFKDLDLGFARLSKCNISGNMAEKGPKA